jgi:membrane fusion protein (multidrug efflux system)
VTTEEAEKTTTAVPTETNTPTPPPPANRGRNKAFLIFFVVLILAAIGGVLYWLHARQFEETDDAEIDAHLNAVSPRIDGTIINVYVDDNQFVKVGQPLVDLDPRDLQVALDQAQAQLLQARSMVSAQQPNIPITQVENFTTVSTAESDVTTAEAGQAAAERDREAAEAKLAESEANLARAQSDLERYKLLIAKEEVSQQEFDQVATTAKAMAATVASNRAALQSSARIVDQRRSQTAAAVSRLSQAKRNGPSQLLIRRATVQSEQASAQTAQTQVEQAQLRLSYTKITAPVDGIVMKRSAEIGSHVAAGQQLMTIAQVDDVWVTANFKETQLQNIRPKQSVTIHVDATKQDLEGYVDTIGGSTGAISSVLPPENATGNYVKVVQRIPVRIRFKKDQKGLDRLRPGMSVEPEVRIGA